MGSNAGLRVSEHDLGRRPSHRRLTATGCGNEVTVAYATLPKAEKNCCSRQSPAFCVLDPIRVASGNMRYTERDPLPGNFSFQVLSNGFQQAWPTNSVALGTLTLDAGTYTYREAGGDLERLFRSSDGRLTALRRVSTGDEVQLSYDAAGAPQGVAGADVNDRFDLTPIGSFGFDPLSE